MKTENRQPFAHHRYFLWLLLAVVCLLASSSAFAQSTTFTYQGKLSDNTNPASGQYDFQFKLFDTATVGTGAQQGSMYSVGNVTVTNGIFTMQLDFGACATCFNGAPRFLEIAVKQTSGSTFTTLSPRQPVTSNPYAIRSLNSMAADGLSVACVNCVTSNQILSVAGSQISGPIPLPSVPAESANYIQNTTTQQASSAFNISGIGSAGVFDATTQYNIGGNRVLGIPGASNLFAGVGAGANHTNSSLNSFFGRAAGGATTDGSVNSFFGALAGGSNTMGSNNSFFGSSAGQNNTTGSLNTLIGYSANVASVNLSNASAIGSRAQVGCDNCLVLGSINGINGATADTKVGIGTTSPVSQLHVKGASPVRILADPLTLSGSEYVDFMARNTAFASDLGGIRIQRQSATGNIDTLIFAAPLGNVASEMMRISGAGKVGIAATAPDAYLQVRATPLNPGSATFFSGAGAMINSATNNGGASPAPPETVMVLAREGIGGQAFANFARLDLRRYENVGTSSRSQLDVRLSHGDLFGEGNNTPVIMSLQSSGNVGIGTTAPTEMLHVLGNGLFAGDLDAAQYNIGGNRVLSNFGYRSVFAGVEAGANATTGNNDSFFGYRAGFSIMGGTGNSLYGSEAGLNKTSGSGNAFFGRRAGLQTNTGNFNSFFGSDSGVSNTSGYRNTLVGHGANVGSGDLTNATAIGASAQVDCSDCLVLGSIAGVNGEPANTNVGIGVTAPTFQLQLSTDSAAKPNGGSWSNPSDARLKENIRPFTDGLAVLRQINPVSYRLNGKAGMPKGEPGIGVIAQEVRDLLPYTISTFKAKLEAGDAEPAELLAFNGSALTFVLINSVKELSARLEALRASNKQVEIAALKQENEAQKQRIADLESRLAAMEQMMKKLIEKP